MKNCLMVLHGGFLVNITEFYRIDQNNPGDLYSNPCRYFFSELETNQIDIDNVRKTSWHQHDAVIVGGGGLLGNPNFESLMHRLTTHPDEQILTDVIETKLKEVSIENKDRLQKWKDVVRKYTLNTIATLDKSIGPRILWGAGYNSREDQIDSFTVNYSDYLNSFHLVGIRDYDVGHRWVPCASCMHPAFDKEYEIRNKVVWFEHKKRLVDNKTFDLMPAPRMMNTGQNMEQIIEFLGSAETVVTNSYHGVYWASLLGRKVVCIPWGSKFNMFKHPPTMATMRNWPEMIDEAKENTKALKECRKANISFYEDVKKLLNNEFNEIEKLI